MNDNPAKNATFTKAQASSDKGQQTSGQGPWGHTEYDQSSKSAAKVLKPEENDQTAMPCKNSLPT